MSDELKLHGSQSSLGRSQSLPEVVAASAPHLKSLIVQRTISLRTSFLALPHEGKCYLHMKSESASLSA